MSSPGARQRRRREQYQAPRSRRELAIAVGAALFIVVATALMIWMLRPGGIADRQPRSSWLFGIAFFAVVIACYVILRPGSRLKVDRRIALAGSLGLIAVVTVAAGVFIGHGGLLRHTPEAVRAAADHAHSTAAHAERADDDCAGRHDATRPRSTTAPPVATTTSTIP